MQSMGLRLAGRDRGQYAAHAKRFLAKLGPQPVLAAALVKVLDVEWVGDPRAGPRAAPIALRRSGFHKPVPIPTRSASPGRCAGRWSHPEPERPSRSLQW